jgi:hypothetical protein
MEQKTKSTDREKKYLQYNTKQTKKAKQFRMQSLSSSPIIHTIRATTLSPLLRGVYDARIAKLESKLRMRILAR